MAKSFMDMGSEAPRERVIVIDALNLGFRWKHQGRTDFADDYMRTVESLASSYNCGSIVILMNYITQILVGFCSKFFLMIPGPK